MKTISIQVEPGRDALFDEKRLAKTLEECGFEFKVARGDDDEGSYIDYYIDTKDLAGAWKLIKNNLISINSIANSCVVICQGNRGWEDILFLHHYDPEADLDELQSH